MPVAIVVVLEGIDVAHDERQHSLVTPRDGKLLRKMSIKPASIGKARQPVLQRQLLECSVCGTQFGGVLSQASELQAVFN